MQKPFGLFLIVILSDHHLPLLTALPSAISKAVFMGFSYYTFLNRQMFVRPLKEFTPGHCRICSGARLVDHVRFLGGLTGQWHNLDI